MTYSTVEAKIRLPYARKSKELLEERAIHHIKLAHPSLKNYYLLIIQDDARDEMMENYSTIGKLNLIEEKDSSANLSTLLDIAKDMELEVIEVNGAPYSEYSADDIDDEDITPIYELNEDTGEHMPCNEAAIEQEQRETDTIPEKPAASSANTPHPEHIICKSKTFNAKLDYTSSGFHIRYGSRLRLDSTASWKGTTAHRQREQLIEDKILVKKGDYLIMMSDYQCKSPSTAASMIRGASSNGWTAMKYSDGSKLIQGKYTYREIDEVYG